MSGLVPRAGNLEPKAVKPMRSTRLSLRARRRIATLVLGLALAAPALSQEVPPGRIEPGAVRPMRSSARTVADIVLQGVQRQRLVETKTRPSGKSSTLLADRVGQASAEALAGGGYDWELDQSWLPDVEGVQWCVSGFQTVEPLGGVKLYVFSRAFPGARALRPLSLVVTLKAQEQVPAPHPKGDPSRMPHTFDYGTCVAPEFTRVGTYATVASFCGSDAECARHPHVLATNFEVKPQFVSFDTCVDRSTGLVDIFFSTLYFDQRPDPASVRLLLSGADLVGTTVAADWPWLMLDDEMPLAEYEARFGGAVAITDVSIASDSPFTPTIRLVFGNSDSLRPCSE